MLNFPKNRSTKGGGRPVTCFDLDGFSTAYGISNNLLENRGKLSLMAKENNIHELSHLVHGIFFEKDQYICEGFAETLPLYTLGYEEKFPLHKEALKLLKEEDILTAEALIQLSKENNFKGRLIIPNASCSFEITYISSYLLVRACLEKIANQNKMDKISCTQKFLEIVKNSNYYQEFLIFDIANAIGVSKEELLNTKKLQLETLNKILNE